MHMAEPPTDGASSQITEPSVGCDSPHNPEKNTSGPPGTCFINIERSHDKPSSGMGCLLISSNRVKIE